MYTVEKIKETQERLLRRGVKYCIGAYVDIHGVPKAKVVPLGHLEHMAHGSELYTGYALDGLGQAPNEDEIASVPDLDHIIQLPWEPKVAWMPADNTFKGKPYPLNTRVALKNVLAQAAELGMGFNLGIECEVFVLRQNSDGTLSIPNPDDKLTKPCYDLRGFLDNFSWLDKVATCINDLGWDLYSFDHEDANGQYEFDFRYADALTMCDRFIFFRYMAKHYAKEEGLLATMMPKPFSNRTGTGAHFNMSLCDLGSGRNLFACPPAEDRRGLGLTETGYHFIGGILRHGRALCAVLAPTVNSYKRLVRQGAMSYFSWAPVFNSYGSNNRTNSVRVPLGGGRCESRNADGAVNPYLAAALALAAGLEGIREKLDPGEPNEDNLYTISESERRDRNIHFLPQTLQEAVAAFAADPLMEATLGKELCDEFIKYKTTNGSCITSRSVNGKSSVTAICSEIFVKVSLDLPSDKATTPEDRSASHPSIVSRFGGLTMTALARRPVSRISISLPEDLLCDLDEMVGARGFDSRSHAVNDMLHQFLVEHKNERGDDVMVGIVALFYNNSVPGLQKQLAELQFRYIDEVISSLHVHLMHNQTMEVILVQGPARKLQMIADEMTSRRGVISGKMHLVASLIPQLHPFIEKTKQDADNLKGAGS